MNLLTEQEKNILLNIEDIGKNCVKNFNTTVLFVNNTSLDLFKEVIMTDWWEALKFFLHHSFMRGRRDELSEAYYNFTIKVLDSIRKSRAVDFFELWAFDYKLAITDFKKRKNIVKGNCLSLEYRDEFHNYLSEINYNILHHFILPLYNQEKSQSEKVYINNDRDLLMILDVLKFLVTKTNCEDYNIVKYSIDKIKSGEIVDLYDNLNHISYIGDKISTFYLRNLAFVFSMTNEVSKLDKKDLKCFLPIDTWISQVCEKTGIIEKENMNNLQMVKENMIEKCNGIVNPLFFNQGAWYLGANSFNMMFELIKNKNILETWKTQN